MHVSAVLLQKLAQHVLLLPGSAPSHGNPFDVLELCGDKLLAKLPLHPFEVYDVSGSAAWMTHDESHGGSELHVSEDMSL
jgi:hypothetical protein